MYINAAGPFNKDWNILREFNVDVKQYPDDAKPAGIIEPNGKAREFHNDVLAAGFFMCTNSSSTSKSVIYKFAGGGTLTGKVEWDAFLKLIDVHPEWSRQDAIKAMENAGARYGPNEKDGFLKHINPAALEPFLGKLQLIAVDFHVRDEASKENPPEFYWIVRVEAQQSSNQKQIYNLFFEPFKGSLYLISALTPTETP